MNALGWLILFLVVALPIGWLAAEFQSRRWLRLSLGIGAILMSFGVAFIVGSLNRFSYNAWYGSATGELIDATIAAVETGQTELVTAELKHLQQEFHPTYENRAHYDVLVNDTVARMRASGATYLHDQLGQTVILEGEALALKAGPLLETEYGGVFIESFHFDELPQTGVDPDTGMQWTESRDEWPFDIRGKRVRVTGRLAERYDLPVLSKEQSEAEEAMQGIPTDFPQGSPELRQASHRYVLEEAHYEILD